MAVVATVTLAASWMPGEPVVAPGKHLALAAVALAGYACLTALLTVVTSPWARAGETWPVDRARLDGRRRVLAKGLWLALMAIVLLGLKWPQLVLSNWQLREAILLDELLLLVPVVAPLVLSWIIVSETERRLAQAQGAVLAHSPSRWAQLVFYCRHEFALVLIPVLLVCGVDDSLRWLLPERWADARTALVLAIALGLLVLALPAMLVRCWSTHRLPVGPLRARLERAARVWRFELRELLAWQTGNRLANAALVGWGRKRRVVLLSDGLVAQMADEQVEAIFAHEVAHAQLRHVQWRLATVLVPVMVWASWVGLGLPTFIAIDGLGNLGLGIVALAGLVGGGWVLGRVAHWTEYAADRQACQLLDELVGRRAPSPSAESVERFCVALRRLAELNALPARRATWLHPAIAARIAMLESTLSAGPQMARCGASAISSR